MLIQESEKQKERETQKLMPKVHKLKMVLEEGMRKRFFEKYLTRNPKEFSEDFSSASNNKLLYRTEELLGQLHSSSSWNSVSHKASDSHRLLLANWDIVQYRNSVHLIDKSHTKFD